ncbi:hypothetical protein BKA60DRAFT_580862 [Fusarium oxysporum]|nr:hypothetical protein DER44DRAFT_798612 [Fusarium oxysporum]KAH7203045.1 hypothetical protein BKA60DRAFT_580862 [Fusarium oxysporum]RKK76830.1 hypothetical protein BFJ71_g16874 [Fusarium oxysporum]
MQECMRASEIRNSEMTAHHQDRAHNNEGSVPNHNGCGSKRRKHWDTKKTTLQNTACASDVRDTQYAFKRVKTGRDFSQPLETGRLHPSVDNEGKVITEEGDEGTEETIPVSENRERRPSSPQPILEDFEKFQEIVAKHNSLRDMARREIQKRYAPATQDAGPATPTAPQSDEYDSLSNNDMQQLNMPSSTVDDKHTHHSPHYPGKLNTTSASQESFEGEWLDDIDPELWPDGKTTVDDDAGYRSS